MRHKAPGALTTRAQSAQWDEDDYGSWFRAELKIANEIAERAATKMPKGTEEFRKAYMDASAEMRKMLGGDATGHSISKLLNGTPEEAAGFIVAAEKQYTSSINLAKLTDDPRALKAAEKALKEMGKHFDSSLTNEMREAARHIDLGAASNALGVAGFATDQIVDGGPLDSMAKVVTVMALMRGGGKYAGKSAKAGKVGGFLKNVVSAGAGGSVKRVTETAC